MGKTRKEFAVLLGVSPETIEKYESELTHELAERAMVMASRSGHDDLASAFSRIIHPSDPYSLPDDAPWISQSDGPFFEALAAVLASDDHDRRELVKLALKPYIPEAAPLDKQQKPKGRNRA